MTYTTESLLAKSRRLEAYRDQLIASGRVSEAIHTVEMLQHLSARIQGALKTTAQASRQAGLSALAVR